MALPVSKWIHFNFRAPTHSFSRCLGVLLKSSETHRQSSSLGFKMLQPEEGDRQIKDSHRSAVDALAQGYRNYNHTREGVVLGGAEALSSSRQIR